MKPITENEFRRLVEYMKFNYGVDLTHKRSLVVGRLENYLTNNNYPSFSEYLNEVMADKSGNASATLINKLTTNHTFFMREPQHFNYFRNVVLPYLHEKEKTKKDIGIWSAGCSSGEEPYTLAMIIDDFFGQEKASWDTKVLATDISTNVLNTAMHGIYPNERIANLPKHWQLQYFTKTDAENSTVVDKIKAEIIFRKFNLMNQMFPFKKKFHVIFCRNVMIYFDNETKHDLVNRFYEHTEDGGYLFIGHSESLNRDMTKYKYIMPAIYRKE